MTLHDWLVGNFSSNSRRNRSFYQPYSRKNTRGGSEKLDPSVTVLDGPDADQESGESYGKSMSRDVYSGAGYSR